MTCRWVAAQRRRPVAPRAAQVAPDQAWVAPDWARVALDWAQALRDLVPVARVREVLDDPVVQAGSVRPAGRPVPTHW